MSWYAQQKFGVLGQELIRLRPQMAAAAQQVYDQWEQDEEGFDATLGGGGICDEVSQAIAGVIVGAVQCETTEGGQDGDDHSFLIAYRDDEAYGVDIPPGVYETGGGYSWRKIPGVTITADNIQVWPIDLPDNFASEIGRYSSQSKAQKYAAKRTYAAKGPQPFEGRLGKCYELAGRYVSRTPMAVLVHGHIFNPWNRNGTGEGFADIDHAWVEQGGKVFDPVMDKWWPKELYDQLFNVQEHARYNYEQVLKMMLRNRHWGPWS